MYLSPLESKGIYRILFAVLAGVDDDYLEKQYPNIDFEDFYTLFIKSTNISLFSACSRFKRSIVLATSLEEVAGYYIDWLDQISGKIILPPFRIVFTPLSAKDCTIPPPKLPRTPDKD